MATGELAKVNGIQMYYQVRGSGQPILLVHGFTGSSADWSLIFKEVPKGYALLEVDLRGHGQSTNPSDNFSFQQCSEDLISLLDQLGYSKVCAIGLSGGGQALLHTATSQPQLLSSMILVSAGPYFPAAARKLMSQATLESKSEADWQYMRNSHKYGDGQIRKLWLTGHAMQDSYVDVNFTPPLLATIQTNTMLVFGDRDPFYPMPIPVEMYLAIPNSSLWVIPNAGHVPIFSNLSSKFQDVALHFLAQQGSND